MPKGTDPADTERRMHDAHRAPFPHHQWLEPYPAHPKKCWREVEPILGRPRLMTGGTRYDAPRM